MYRYIRPYLKFVYGIVRTVALWVERVALWLFSGALSILPTRFLLGVRQRTQVVRRTDYKLPLHMYVDSRIELETRLREVEKEPETVQWIEEWFQPGDVFYDIGANVGSYSLIATRFLQGNIRVFAFEPSFMNFSKLCRNIALNNVQDQVTPFQIALYDQNAVVPFHYYSMDSGSALHSLGLPQNWRGDDFTPSFSLPTISFPLDDFVRQFAIAPPNHLKVDVDGVEYQILQGAKGILAGPELRSILIEANEDYVYANELKALFEEFDWVLQSRSGYLGENCLFVRKS